MYCDLSGNISSFLNRFQKESLMLHPTVTLDNAVAQQQQQQ